MSVKRDAKKLVEQRRLDDLRAYQEEVAGVHEFYELLRQNWSTRIKDDGSYEQVLEHRPLDPSSEADWSRQLSQAAEELRRSARTGQPFRPPMERL